MKVYFDFLCPYCYRGVTDLLELMDKYPELDIDWQPVEAHPRPEYAWQYSDIASQGLLYIKEHGLNEAEYCRLVYKAHYKDNKRIDDIGTLSRIAESIGADRAGFENALKSKRYEQAVLDNNDLVWERLRYDAVPDYIEGDKELLSIEDHMISKDRLEDFIGSLIQL